jgi:hypothetical protein
MEKWVVIIEWLPAENIGARDRQYSRGQSIISDMKFCPFGLESDILSGRLPIWPGFRDPPESPEVGMRHG